ncbi:hypothetical protein VB774_05995 [Pseudanabaena galeata UHCC 0370]|uniref:Transposase n=1 Tax=Pseudanabaena galeata UHCC 0370 TaxID=3110310 RepID=A0ABU5TGJ9_9CYAN|nr:hypothetical protein [Pseudanabaena galeata]MEA5477168.1 hypothetical protein [Pseudanabaena galeata UHCC 0370]
MFKDASNSHYKNRFFESSPTASFQKNFGVSSAEGAGNTKIGFIMGIAGYLGNSKEKMIPIKPKNNVAGLARHIVFGFSYFV